jgi:hypothetical protein
VELEPELACRRLQVFLLNLGHRVSRVVQQDDRARSRHHLVDQLEALLPGIHVQRDDAGHIAARSIEARDESGFDRIDAAVEHNGNRSGRRLGRLGRGISAKGGNHRDLTANEIRGELRQPLVLVVGPAIFDHRIAAFDHACFVQALPKRRELRRISLRRCCA